MKPPCGQLASNATASRRRTLIESKLMTSWISSNNPSDSDFSAQTNLLLFGELGSGIRVVVVVGVKPDHTLSHGTSDREVSVPRSNLSHSVNGHLSDAYPQRIDAAGNAITAGHIGSRVFARAQLPGTTAGDHIYERTFLAVPYIALDIMERQRSIRQQHHDAVALFRRPHTNQVLGRQRRRRITEVEPRHLTPRQCQTHRQQQHDAQTISNSRRRPCYWPGVFIHGKSAPNSPGRYGPGQRHVRSRLDNARQNTVGKRDTAARAGGGHSRCVNHVPDDLAHRKVPERLQGINALWHGVHIGPITRESSDGIPTDAAVPGCRVGPKT